MENDPVFEGRVDGREQRRHKRESRHRVHSCICISFLEHLMSKKSYGCNEQHYVLDLIIQFCHNLATFVWINY